MLMTLGLIHFTINGCRNAVEAAEVLRINETPSVAKGPATVIHLRNGESFLIDETYDAFCEAYESLAGTEYTP